jgi:WD40 repeat protein
MVWSEDGSRLVLETDPGQAVTVWDMNAGRLVTERKDGTYPADIHGDLLAYRGVDGSLALWDLQKNAEKARLPGPVTSFSSGIKFSPHGEQIAYGVGSGLHIASIFSGKMIAIPDAQLLAGLGLHPGTCAPSKPERGLLFR